MHFLNLSQFFKFSQFFNEMKNNEEESFLSSFKCRIRTVYYGLVSFKSPLIALYYSNILKANVLSRHIKIRHIEEKYENKLAQACLTDL